MKYFWYAFLFILTFGLINPGPGFSEEPNRGVAVGLRATHFVLTQGRGPIFRAISVLDETQNYVPIKPVIQYKFSEYWAVELGYDQFKVTTGNQGDNSHDGDIEWNPLMLALQIRVPFLNNTLVPYASWGVSYNKISFTERPWYRWGFPDPQTYSSWVGQGNLAQDYPNNAYRRKFTTDDSYGTFFGLGIDYFFARHWAVNLDYRYHLLRTNFRYVLAYDEGATVTTDVRDTFKLDHWVIGVGLKYFFF